MNDSSGDSMKLASYFEQKNDYSIFVGLPLHAPRAWVSVTHLDGNYLCGEEFERYAIDQLEAWLVAYAGNGEIVDGKNIFEPLPRGIVSIQQAFDVQLPKFTFADLLAGLQRVDVQFGPSSTHSEKEHYYSTTLINLTGHRIKCLGFGGYSFDGKEFKLFTVTKTHYSSEQFEEWYAVRRGGWVGPGESVVDPSNYGSPCYWVYYFCSEAKERFVTGKLFKKPGLLRRLLGFRFVL